MLHQNEYTQYDRSYLSTNRSNQLTPSVSIAFAFPTVKMEKQSNPLLPSRVPFVISHPPSKVFFSSIYPGFILLLHLSHLCPSSPILSVFWNILTHTQTCYNSSHLSETFSWSYTTSVPFFFLSLYWNLKEGSLLCFHFLTSKSLLNLL